MNSISSTRKYLGVPIIEEAPKIFYFFFFETKLTTGIHNWKWKALSMAGKATLIKSMSSSIPLYAFSCIHISSTITARIEKEYRNIGQF